MSGHTHISTVDIMIITVVSPISNPGCPVSEYPNYQMGLLTTLASVFDARVRGDGRSVGRVTSCCRVEWLVPSRELAGGPVANCCRSWANPFSRLSSPRRRPVQRERCQSQPSPRSVFDRPHLPHLSNPNDLNFPNYLDL